MENRKELTDSKNQIQWHAYTGMLIFALISILFTFSKNYIQAIIAALGFFIVAFFVFAKKQNYKRIFFDEYYLYYDAEKISLESLRDIKISKWNKQYGVLEYDNNGKTENIYFAGYSKINFELLKSYKK